MTHHDIELPLNALLTRADRGQQCPDCNGRTLHINEPGDGTRTIDLANGHTVPDPDTVRTIALDDVTAAAATEEPCPDCATGLVLIVDDTSWYLARGHVESCPEWKRVTR